MTTRISYKSIQLLESRGQSLSTVSLETLAALDAGCHSLPGNSLNMTQNRKATTSTGPSKADAPQIDSRGSDKAFPLNLDYRMLPSEDRLIAYLETLRPFSMSTRTRSHLERQWWAEHVLPVDGAVAWYEPIRLWLPDGLRYGCDFAVLGPNGLTLAEVKGVDNQASRVRFRAARGLCPGIRLEWWRWDRKGRRWKVE